MHGRPRLPPGQSPAPKDQSKAKKLNALLEDVLRNHHEKCYTKEALKQSGQLLEINPEFYTAWNYRKIAVQHLLELEPDEAGRKRVLEEELRLVEKALLANLKSYGAWYHRRWVLEFGSSSLDHEFYLLQKLLKLDSRNFHAWKHRRFCAAASKVTAEEELQYATEKINENFSNYSAWHYRSLLLSQLVNRETSKEDILKDEYELVNQAYFTEPDDQSAWFYNTWLHGQTRSESGAQLVGIWPSNGDTILADARKKSSGVHLSSKNPLGKSFSFSSQGLPVILSFSKIIPTVDVKVISNAEFEHLGDVHWHSLSGEQRPSKVWVAEFPFQDCSAGEYDISIQIFPQEGMCQETEIKFNLRVSSGNVPGEDKLDENRSCQVKRAFCWPGKILDNHKKEESRQDLEKEHDGGPVGNLTSETETKTLTSAVGKVDWQQNLLKDQIQNLRKLLELEPKSKWAKLILSKVLSEYGARIHNSGHYIDEVLDLLKELTQLDPYRSAYYESLFSSIYCAKLVQNSNSLKELWWEPQEVESEQVERIGWLRWNGLSLSKFDSVSRLLWVQRLDLSDNHLSSLDGLEAMQLLVALDISHNRIPSIMSLAPIRLIPKLQYLDIAHNEIGSHLVDSARYSFPSALTNQKSSVLEEHKLHQEVIGGAQWEVQAVFGGLKLKVLEISGNVAANDKIFREALAKALPSLELLDGEQV